MNRFLKPAGHVVVDLLSVATMAVAPRLLGLQGRAATASYALAGSYLGVSLITRAPGGLLKLLPFETHGRIELSTAPLVAGLPWLLHFAANPRERNYFLGLAAFAGLVWSVTDWKAPEDEHDYGSDPLSSRDPVQ
ncbi:hypothetical protein HNR42_000112 [Deinobacterium chartae]|uniref:Uncharacterized protein n=1 Tax=Deinobacterium chartae TaxID=521158 RepID=A0A841HWX5_9DEIO|nr:hypothetical protein [Deinobacterium chartae]MBB6096700.1 hypothetical protein [Deinobacterium chartae]